MNAIDYSTAREITEVVLDGLHQSANLPEIMPWEIDRAAAYAESEINSTMEGKIEDLLEEAKWSTIEAVDGWAGEVKKQLESRYADLEKTLEDIDAGDLDCEEGRTQLRRLIAEHNRALCDLLDRDNDHNDLTAKIETAHELPS